MVRIEDRPPARAIRGGLPRAPVEFEGNVRIN